VTNRFIAAFMVVAAGCSFTVNGRLTALEREARAFTPRGAHERELTRYGCGESGDDSSPPTVERVLEIGERQPAEVRTELLRRFVHAGWTENTAAPYKSATRGNDVLWIGVRHRSVIISITAGGVLC
jgi:hypothetical protein